PKTTGYLLKQYCIGIVQVFRSEIYQNALGVLESCTLALALKIQDNHHPTVLINFLKISFRWPGLR
ncbi:MAG: hypothetical protein RSA84_12560, partial [Acinetobacter sp.]